MQIMKWSQHSSRQLSQHDEDLAAESVEVRV